ncbi:MAG: FxLYD domain-containing protein [bacterium]|nr:FxLYD domain-containing protein [bacterium]
MKGFIWGVVILVIVIVGFKVFNSVTKNARETAQQAEIVSKMRAEKYDEAKELIVKYYKDTDKAKELLAPIKVKEDEIALEAYTDKIKIPDDWEWKADEKNSKYTSIHGKIVNTGDKTITSFTILAKYQDGKKKTLSTDSANCSESVPAGQTKNFEIKHGYSSDYKSVVLSVKNFTLDQQ